MNVSEVSIITKREKSIEDSLSFRKPMIVTEVIEINDSVLGPTYYSICPRCHKSMERDVQSYCDRCGQCLSWKSFRKAKVVYPLNKSK